MERVEPIPIIDIEPLCREAAGQTEVAARIGQACREHGFFYIVGHGIPAALKERLVQVSRSFFDLDLETKMGLRMERGGRAWRGYFPVGGELTSGQPDLKEGLYFGAELGADHPLVQAGTPLHGQNLFPETLPQLREVVLDYMAAMTRLGHVLMAGIALSLGLARTYFADRYTAEPLVLFRIFHYPPDPARDGGAERWGVGEHTDYGMLTILLQDDTGGLEVKSRSQWLPAPPVPGSFVCNIGDMLDRMTRGLYRSTAHRVRNRTHRGRLSFPFFFDPNLHAEVRPIELSGAAERADDQAERWDHASVHAFQGTYGDYLLAKVARVFPLLHDRVLR
jgi:isopenicillin N synthase-like dioxygenase